MDVEFHPTGTAIGSANSESCVKIYDLRTDSLQQLYTVHDDTVNKAKFHPNGKFMATASSDSTIKVQFRNK